MRLVQVMKCHVVQTVICFISKWISLLNESAKLMTKWLTLDWLTYSRQLLAASYCPFSFFMFKTQFHFLAFHIYILKMLFLKHYSYSMLCDWLQCKCIHALDSLQVYPKKQFRCNLYATLAVQKLIKLILISFDL